MGQKTGLLEQLRQCRVIYPDGFSVFLLDPEEGKADEREVIAAENLTKNVEMLQKVFDLGPSSGGGSGIGAVVERCFYL